MRVAVAAGPGRTALLQELAEDGSGYAAPALVNDFPAAVAEYERARPGDEHVRWVWADTSATYPSLLRAGVRVDRCHDAALTEALLCAREGAGLGGTGHPRPGLSGTGLSSAGPAGLPPAAGQQEACSSPLIRASRRPRATRRRDRGARGSTPAGRGGPASRRGSAAGGGRVRGRPGGRRDESHRDTVAGGRARRAAGRSCWAPDPRLACGPPRSPPGRPDLRGVRRPPGEP